MTLSDRLRPWHRRNAFVLLVFLTAHIATHLSAVFGPDSHSALMDALRIVYRAPVIEFILIGLFVIQVGLGLVLVWPRIRQSDKSAWSWIQIISGLYLALFILNHIFLGVLRGRTYEGVETGFHFVASTLMTAPIQYGFIPYYYLAVLSLFAHLAAALHWAGKSDFVTRSIIVAGSVIAGLIVAAYGGFLYDIVLPDAYQNYLRDAF